MPNHPNVHNKREKELFEKAMEQGLIDQFQRCKSHFHYAKYTITKVERFDACSTCCRSETLRSSRPPVGHTPV
jgi:hypothetical protein